MKPETLNEQLFFTTTFIGTTNVDGTTGAGTGFLYQVETAADQSALFLVTNRHVVKDAARADVRFMASKDDSMTEPSLGQVHVVQVPDPASVFTVHPDSDIDVAIAPVTPWVNALKAQGRHVFFRSISPAIAMNNKSASALDALEEVTFIGYPNGLYDQVNLLPIARRGSTATPPALDYGGKPTFLIDASVFPGSSGSPVMLAQTGSYTARGGGLVVGNRIMWLGIVAAVYQRQVPVLHTSTATSFIHDTLNIGIVYKASAVDEVVDVLLGTHGLSRYQVQPAEPVSTPDVSQDALADTEPGA